MTHTSLMHITTGSRLGPYEIVARIGAGGMGEVFRAKDTRLDRTVAIKVLPSHLSSNPQLRERLDREARAVSSLSHPHICTLFDVGHQDGVDYFVMEHLEGENLADRVARGPLPIDQVLRYGAQLGHALASAHKQGIVHRDLKPGNVMLTKAGAKLLDFGLAKISPTAVVTPDAATEHKKPLTAEGTMLGTFQYMAPEQLEGAEADARTDIFALGVVLYEMATGRRAFEGKTKTSLIASIVAGQPRRIEELQPFAPRGLAHVVDKCLEKEPDHRWQSAHDVAEELKWIEESGARESIVPPEDIRRSRRKAALAGVLLLVAGTAGGFAAAYFRRSESATTVQATIVPPRGITVAPSDGDHVVLSPDGRAIAFTGRDSNGKSLLWLRSLGELDARPLNATDGARHPFWSPDGQAIAFFAGTRLKKISLDGSPPVTICEVAANPMAGSWNSEGIILFSPSSLAPIHQVSAAGGRSVAVTTLDRGAGESTHRWARFLPDGKSFLYMAGIHGQPDSSEVNAIYSAKLGSPDRKLILRARSNIEYVDGHLMFVRDHILFAQRFDPGTMKVEGEQIPLVKNVHYSSSSFFSAFSFAGAERLLYTTADAKKQQQVVWLDRSGKQTGIVAAPSEFESWSLSPDNKKLAFTIKDLSVGNDIWLHDLSRDGSTRFTLGGSGEQAVWSPDGKRIAYAGDKNYVYVRNVEGEGKPEVLLESKEWGGPTAWSPDGQYLTYWAFDSNSTTNYDAFILPLGGDRKLIPLATTNASEFPGSFSPDGRWVLYGSDQTGRDEIYVVSFPDLQRRQQISVNGVESQASWAGPREIWYRQPGGTWVSVTIADRDGTAVEVSAARALFRDEQIVGLEPATSGDRLIAAREIGETAPPQIVLVTGWKRLLHARRQ